MSTIEALKEDPVNPPRFQETWCSQCGADTGPGDHGYSYCSNHTVGVRRPEAGGVRRPEAGGWRLEPEKQRRPSAAPAVPAPVSGLKPPASSSLQPPASGLKPPPGSSTHNLIGTLEAEQEAEEMAAEWREVA